MPVKTSELPATPDLTPDDLVPVLDGTVLSKATIAAILDLAVARLAILGSGPSVAAYADPARPERTGTTFLDHDGILWRVNAADGTESSQTPVVNLVKLALEGVDLLGAPQVLDAAELAADDVLSYQDGESLERVTEGLPIYGSGGFAWIVIEESPSYTAHVQNANGVNFREVGRRFSSLGRFQRAVLLGDAYPDAAVVQAASDFYVKDGTTGGAVEGWRLIPSGGALAGLDLVTAAYLGDQSVTAAKLNNAIYAAQASAEAGTGNGLMTAERTRQAVAAQTGEVARGIYNHGTATFTGSGISSVTESPAGVFSVLFADPQPDTNYVPDAVPLDVSTGTASAYAKVTSRTVNGFEVRTGRASDVSAVLESYSFGVRVWRP